jgi:hypothetical protein
MYRFLDESRWYCFAEGESDPGPGGPTAPTTPPADPPAQPAAPTAPAAAPETPAPATDTLLAKAPEAPEVFNAEKLVLPEGAAVDEGLMGKFKEVATGLPHAKAQALLDLYLSTQGSEVARNADFWKTTRDGWEAEVRADPLVGGDKLETVVQTVAKVLDNPQLTDPGFRQALNFTGLGSHPAAVRTLYRWAQALTEGSPVAAGGPPSNVGAKPGVAAERTAAEILFPDQKIG